ncbi:MAG: 4Fe-4S dicluster domain-containing protein [Patescibacteria group bacterium]
MKITDIHKIIRGLNKKYQIYAPQMKGGRLVFDKLRKPEDFDYSGRIPENSFKHIVYHDGKLLYEYQGTKIKVDEPKSPFLALFGLTIFDIKALDFYNHVMEKDPYFQATRRELVVVGQSYVAEKGDFADEIEQNYEDNVLEHVQFDIFLKRVEKNRFKLYTGTRKGQKILEFLGFTQYDHIQFKGLACDFEPANVNKKNILATYQGKIWEEWGKKCLNCGKCTVVCPTCYCYELEHTVKSKASGRVKRRWSSCFFSEFSEVAGGHKFLKNSADRIYNWYYHKHVRNHDELCLVGCVGCGRCDRVCPAGIKRLDVLNSLKPKKIK